MKQSIILAIALPLMLTACFEDRKNPVLEAQQEDTVLWFKKIATDETDRCTPFWAHPAKATELELNSCKNEKERVVKALNDGQFSQEKVILEDLNPPTVWMRYNELVQSKASLQRALAPAKSTKEWRVEPFSLKARERLKSGE